MPQDVFAATGDAATANENLGTIVVNTGSKVGTSIRQIYRPLTVHESVAITGLTETYLNKWDDPRYYTGDAIT